MEDDHRGNDGNGKARRIRSLHKKRLMRVSTRASEGLKEPTKLDQRYEGDIGIWVQKLSGDMDKPKRKPNEQGENDCDLEGQPKCRKEKEHLVDAYVEETDYIIEALHKLKRWMNRMWRWGQCYTQYCYPSFRTVEYYRKVKEHQRRKKKCLERKANRYNKSNDPGNKSATASSPTVVPSDHSKHKSEKIEKRAETDTEDVCLSEGSPKEVNYLPSDSDKILVPLNHVVNNETDDSLLSWTEYISKQFNNITETMALHTKNEEEPFRVSLFVKWVFYLFLPAVLLLGVHYLYLKRKYKTLSGKLKRIKDENYCLVMESNKLESMLINTEQLTMSMSTKESRAQAVADFTRLSESLMNSKKEMSQMKTEKAALLEELKRARKKRDEAHKQYSSLTNGIIENGHCAQTQSAGV